MGLCNGISGQGAGGEDYLFECGAALLGNPQQAELQLLRLWPNVSRLFHLIPIPLERRAGPARAAPHDTQAAAPSLGIATQQQMTRHSMDSRISAALWNLSFAATDRIVVIDAHALQHEKTARPVVLAVNVVRRLGRNRAAVSAIQLVLCARRSRLHHHRPTQAEEFIADLRMPLPGNTLSGGERQHYDAHVCPFHHRLKSGNLKPSTLRTSLHRLVSQFKSAAVSAPPHPLSASALIAARSRQEYDATSQHRAAVSMPVFPTPPYKFRRSEILRPAPSRHRSKPGSP